MAGLSCAILLAAQLTASAATLVNRYSFTDDGTGTNVVDSIGGPAWNGILPNGGDFATSPGQLILAAGGAQYVQFPAGIISNYTTVTIEMWATLGTLPDNCFLWGFGNTVSGSGGNCIFMQPKNGRLAISGAQPSWTAEENTGGAGDLSGQTIHVTCVINPPAGSIALYTNGVLVSQNTGETVPLASVNSVFNYIAKSLYDSDSYADVTVDEYRIWNGALNSLEVAGCEVAGPNTVGSAADAGTVTNIALQVPYYQLVQGGHEATTVMADASAFPAQVEIGRLCTYFSGNTNILTVTTNGVINAIGQGSTTITARYGIISNSVTITVVPPVSVIVHRYSFATDASDSVGGSAWDGTLPNGGDLTTTPGQLMLSAAGAQFMQFPAGILSNYTAVTVDAWASFPSALPGNCFFWGFGDVNGNAGRKYIFAQPSAGVIGITGGDPGWSGPEQRANGAGNLSLRTNAHVTAVFNPVAGWIALYVNGALVGKNTTVTWQMNNVSSLVNYIAKSLYSGDGYIDVNVDEFRIYNGAVSSQGVAIADIAGPDSMPNTITNGPGTLLGFSIDAPTTLKWPQLGTVKVLANYQYLTNYDLVANSIFPPAGLTITSSDTNVVVYGSDSKLHAVNAGTANISVTFQGVTTLKSITVYRDPAPALIHRYSFSETSGSDVLDSVGGANGTLPNGGTFGGGQLSLTAASSQYVDLPAGLVSGLSAVTIEAWATFGTIPNNSCFFGFGDINGGAGRQYLFCAPAAGRWCISTNDPGWQGTGEQNAYSGVNWSGRTIHITAVVKPAEGYIAILTNGVLAGINNLETQPLSGVVNNFSYIGKSLYSGDPYFSATLNEFRIYDGALNNEDTALTETLGPDFPLSPALSATIIGGNIAISWPTNYASPAFTLVSSSALGTSWNTVGTAPSTVGTNFQVTVPRSTTAQFFRLRR